MGMVSVVVSARSLIVDDFTAGAGVVQRTPANDRENPATLVQTGLDPAAVLGGTRTTVIGYSGADDQRVTIDPDAGTFVLDKLEPTTDRSWGYVNVSYGSSDSPLGVDLTADGNDRFIFDATSPFVPGWIGVTSGGASRSASFRFSDGFGEIDGPEPVLFSDFPGIDWTDVSVIEIDIIRSSGVTIRSLTTAGPTLPGDFDHSGQVDQGDLDLLLTNWGAAVDPTAWPEGWRADLPRGTVDQDELDRVLQGWGGVTAPDFRGVSVPEPGVAGLVVLASAWLRHRGR